MSHGGAVSGYLVGFAISFAPTALALLCSAMLSRRSVEEWKLLAWVPPLPLVAWWLYFLVAVLRDPSSHNLWPLELVLWSLVSAGLFVAFLAGRRIVRSGDASLSRWRR